MTAGTPARSTAHGLPRQHGNSAGRNRTEREREQGEGKGGKEKKGKKVGKEEEEKGNIFKK